MEKQIVWKFALRMFLITWMVIHLLHSIPIEAAINGDVRLANSNRYGEGRVEVFHEGNWGTVCHLGWDRNDTEVVCRQLGFNNGAQRFFAGARFGEGSGRVLLSDVNCVGNENSLLECGNVEGNWDSNDCLHGSDVGVQCSAPNFEGCFRIGLLSAINGFQADDMTLEKCFLVCSSRRYRYIWTHNRISCDCGNEIDRSGYADKEECSMECAGNSDQICGGRDAASVYKAEVDLPYVASPGFPGGYTSTVGSIMTRNFIPQGETDYSYIRFHQFELPSTASLLVSSNGRNVTVAGGTGVGEYWISSPNRTIQITFQPPQETTESLGFLLEFGEGTYCRPENVSNGVTETNASLPFTVGTQIKVLCHPGFIALDDTVFCQPDGSYNREIRCYPNVTTPAATTQQSPPPPATTQHSVPVVTNVIPSLPLNTPIAIPGFPCSVPSFDNGRVNATPGREILEPGDVLVVTCNPAYEAVDGTVTCQRNGTLTSIPECRFNNISFIIVIAIAAIVLICIIVLFVLLVCCSCYFGRKKRRRVSNYQRRNESAMNELEFRGPHGGPPRLTSQDDLDESFTLPGGGRNFNAYTNGMPPPPLPPESSDSDTTDRNSVGRSPTSNMNENRATGEFQMTDTNAEQDALRSLDNVVNDMERETLYEQETRPTIAASGGFGGHFSRT